MRRALVIGATGSWLVVRSSWVVVGLSLAFASPLLHAQTAVKRLSDWLLEQPPSATAYPLGLSWRVPEEISVQSALRLELLASLSAPNTARKADAETVSRLGDWLRSLPVTGRVPVAVADARWLQANRARDPVLLPGHSVVLPARPLTVTVVIENGTRCRVPHVPGTEVKAYLSACGESIAAKADWAWVAQPDGRVQRFGIASWNREAQDVPAPGAWIWAPPRDSGWPDRFSQILIEFLATQGPAPDASSRPSESGTGVTIERARDRGTTASGGASEGLVFSDLAGVRADRDTQQTTGGSGLDATFDGVVTVGPPQQLPGRSRSLEVTANDWGSVGLLQTPTARMRPSGHFSFHYSRVQPYGRGNLFAQPFDWLEAGFRYTEINNRLYGPPDLSGDQTFKDKGFDVKLRLWPESAYLPAIAVGGVDIAGTGLFSGEYLVASKRTGAFDWSLGMGWGYVAGQARSISGSQGGSFDIGNYFSGRPLVFGGLQWQTPWERLTLKLEHDANDYQIEPLANPQPRSSPWNFGLVYRAAHWADFTLGVERGNTLMLSFTLNTNLKDLSTPKLNDPPRVPVAAARPPKPPDWQATLREIERQTDWHVSGVSQRGGELYIAIEDAEGFYWRDRVDRVAAVLHRDAPQSVDRFVLTYRQRGAELSEHVVDRDAWVSGQLQPVPPSARRETVIARAPEHTAAGSVHESQPRPRFEAGFRIGFRQVLGGPDAFSLYQIYAEESAQLRLRDDTWLQGSLRLGLIDNYDKFKFTGPSNLPRVRTFQREYLTTSDLTMPNLQLTHVGKLSTNQYYSAYGGYLEEYFAGAGGEWLYRPMASRIALGVDVNGVQQRDFEQDFGLRDYRTVTGHGTVYWDTGWSNVLAVLSAGRYLAGDSGVTVQLSRVFRNGVTVGAFFTKTNVSAEQFGEGSFDKGVFVSIPFDTMLSRSSSSFANFLWRPLTRDGGAMLARSVTLYGLTGPRDDRVLEFKAAPPPNDTVIPADRKEAWQPPEKVPEPFYRITARPPAAQWITGSGYEHRLIEALYAQHFRNIRVEYDTSHRLTVALSNDRIYPISRAVGRAARTALRLAPAETREIRITYADRINPVVTYEFFDLARLDGYFGGAVSESELAAYVDVDYLDPGAREKNPLAKLGEPAADVEPPVLAAIVPETRTVGRVVDDYRDAARTAADVNWLRAGAVGAGIVIASSVLDDRAFRFAQDHASSRWMTEGVRLGNAIPWLGLAGSALVALDGSDPVRSRTGYAAAEAGVTAFVVATGLKTAVGRARPNSGLGKGDFETFSSDDRHQSFPSRHATVAWAVATPFALEYNAPWLYGVAALTNLARIGSREHWVSDTVGSSLIGYGLGRIFWQSSRSPKPGEPQVTLDLTGIKVGWQLQ